MTKFLSFQSQYYARADVSLPGFAKFFSAASKEERDHAEKLMDYLNQRGGEVKLQDVKVNISKRQKCVEKKKEKHSIYIIVVLSEPTFNFIDYFVKVVFILEENGTNVKFIRVNKIYELMFMLCIKQLQYV